MYENSESSKKFQKWFNYTICDTEPKMENSATEIHAYRYQSSSVCAESWSFGSNDYLVL